VKRTLLAMLASVAAVTGLLAAAPAQAAPAPAAPTQAAAAQAAASACPFAERHEWEATKIFRANECYRTPGGTLVMQDDGNLVIYDNDWKPICHANTWGFPNSYTAFQTDGNLVVYSAGNRALAASNTGIYPGSRLIFNVNARLRIRNAEGFVVWDMCRNGFVGLV